MEIRRRKLAITILALFTVLSVGTAMLLPAEASAVSRPGKVKSLKVRSTGYSKLTVSWKRVKNAKGYQIYRATKKNGTYKKVKTIKTAKTVSWTNKKLTTGKRYYYKVRAYRGSRKGSFSAKKSGVPKLSKTSGVKASATSRSAIKISWSKTSGATGYQVYRVASKNGSYSKIKTTNATSYTNSGLSASKTYYYKVRSYRKVGKTTKYSSFSSVVSAKTKAKVVTPSNPSKPAEPSNPTDPTGPTNPSKPSEPSEPGETMTLKVVDRESGKEVTELQAGKTYDVESSSTVYIGTDKSSVGTAASANKAAQICHYARRELHPVSQGVFWLKNEDGVRSYKVTKGTTIQTGGLNVELGGGVPSGYVESYDTIYGYTQYVYNKDKANLVLVGAENGAIKTVFTMGTYSMNTDEEYLSVKTAEFGGTTIQPIRYYSNKITEGSLTPSAMELKNEGILANYVTNAVRLKHDSGILYINAKLTQGAEEQSVRVSEWTGDSEYWHYIGGNPGERYGALGVEAVNENITSGGMGSQHCIAVQAVENFYTSAGHVQNLLDESHQFIGTGIVYNGADDFTVTQAYADPQS